MSTRNNQPLSEALRFGFVGVINVAINAGVYALLVYYGQHYILASAAGTALGIINAFLLSKFFVFKRPGRVVPQFLRTLAVYGVQIAMSWSGLAILIELLNINPYSAYLLNIVVVTAVSFFGLKYFAFAKPPEDRRMLH